MPAQTGAPPRHDISDFQVQDQNGTVTTFGDLLRTRPSVLTFFYMRCANPNKCSLTISKLGSTSTSGLRPPACTTK